ncbi:MAG: tRNA-dihydrouridine synthase, partial [Spirochaetales bacterium]|nr:tRNA-dihydrouridine synthase [Spirochaetales bacterium]
IVHTIVRSTDVPVSVKIRLGWDSENINYLEAADAAVNGGASLIAMHARTRAQGYSGNADWSHLKILKKHISLPVAGSGDLFSPQAAKQMLELTGVDGLMFARGAVGNPFIFSMTRQLLETGELSEPVDFHTRLIRIFEQLDIAIEEKGEYTACREMRKQFSAYTKGFPGAAALRSEIVQAETRNDYVQLLRLDQYPAEW